MPPVACGPTRVYGPYEHHLFLGLSVHSFSASLGWNSQGSRLTVRLYEDTCACPAGEFKRYYDHHFQPQQWTAADPGLVPTLMEVQVNGSPHGTATQTKRVEMFPPVVGEPVFFKFHDFEFSGIIQSVEQAQDIGGNKSFVVNITDPRAILEGAQLITGSYGGTVMNTPNLLNVFGTAEALFSNGISSCTFVTSLVNSWLISGPGYPLGLTTGFGGSLNDENGMPWAYIKVLVHLLTAQQNPLLIDTSFGLFCHSGRLQHQGDRTPVVDVNGNSTGEYVSRLGMGYVGTDYRFHAYSKYQAAYLVDLSEIPDFNEIGDVFIRVGSSTSMSLLDAIDNVCSQLAVDYYVELMYTKNPNNPDSGLPFPFIKVRTVNKKTQNEAGKIQEFVAAEEAAGRPVAQYTYGQELRNEVTSSFIVGGDRRDMIEANNTAILPYWGLDGNNNIITMTNPDAGVITNNSYFTINVSALDIGITTHTITIGEIRAALISQDAWMSYLGGNTTHPTTVALGLATYAPYLMSNTGLGILLGANPGLIRAADFRRGRVEFTGSAFVDPAERLYNTVRNLAEEYYGKQFLVPIPSICYRYLPDSIQYLPSHEIATDGGWPSVIDPTMGYAKLVTTGGSIFFRNEEGLLQTFVTIDSVKAALLDYSEIDPNDSYYSPLGPYLFLKANVESQFVFGNYTSKTSPYAVVSLSSPLKVRAEDNDVSAISGGLALILWNQAVHNGYSSLTQAQMNTALLSAAAGGTGRLAVNIPGAPQHLIPDFAAVPVKSNIQSYGPWSSYLDPTEYGLSLSQVTNIPPGKVFFEKDEELVPWRFGSTTNLNTLGMIKALDYYSKVYAEEMGSLRLPGYPTKPLGHELMANDLESAATRTAIINYVTSMNDASYSIPFYTARIRDTAGNTIYTNTDLNYRGNWNGDYGPTITDIGINISIDEVSTDYSFRTFTEQIGRFSKSNIERVARINRQQMNISRYMRQVFKPKLPKFGKSLYTGYGPSFGGGGGGTKTISNTRGGAKKKTGISTPQTPGKSSNVITGSAKVLTSGARTYTVVEVQSSDLEDSKIELSAGTSYVAMVGMEGLFRPVAIGPSAVGGGLPRLKNSGEVSGNAITAANLNPFLHPSEVSALGLSNVTTNFGGHDMIYGARGMDVVGTPHTSGYKMYDGPYPDYTANVYRAMALRGPLLIAGWGYSTAGYPVPNESGDNGTSTKFVDDYLRRYDLWKVGPLDARWDESRGVWVAGGSGATLITAILSENMLNDSGVYNAVTLGSTEIGGTGTGGQTITITNILKQPVASGTRVLLYKDEAHNTHILIRAEHNPLCVVTKVDCYTNQDGDSAFEVRGRQIFLDTAWTTESVSLDNSTTQNESGICGTGIGTFDFNAGNNTVFHDDTSATDYGYAGLSARAFGASNTGAADATDNIQEAIDFAGLLLNGANVFLNNGIYSVARASAAAANNYMLFNQSNNVTLRGEGPSTVLKAASGTSAAMITTPTNVVQSGFEIRDMTLDGNYRFAQWGWENYSDNGSIVLSSGNATANVYDQHGISLYNMSGVRIHNVNVKNMGMDGIKLVSCYDVHVNSVTVSDVGNHCLSAYYCQNLRIDSSLFINPNQSPDSGVTKNYYYSADGYAAIYVYGGPNTLVTNNQLSNIISISQSQIYTTTGRGIVVDNTASDISIINNTIESLTRTNTVINGRTLIDVRHTGSVLKRVKILNNTLINRDVTHPQAYSVYINDVDNLDFSHNDIQGGSNNLIINCSDAQIETNDFELVRGIKFLEVYGTSGSYIQNLSINNNKFRRGASGLVGLYTDYMLKSEIKGNMCHSLSGTASGSTPRGCVYISHNQDSTFAQNHSLDSIGIMMNPSGFVSGCIVHDNRGSDHVISAGQLLINYCHHNIPSGYDSAVSISLGLTQSGVTFGNSAGGLAQDTNYFKYNSTTHELFASSIISRGVFIQQSGEIEVDASGRGLILRSLNGTRWRLIITDQGSVYTTSL